MAVIEDIDRPFELGGRWSYGGTVHDISRWPLIVITLPADGPDKIWRAFLKRVEDCYDEGFRGANGYKGKYCIILDISAVTNNNAQRRREWDALMQRFEAISKRDCLGLAVVISSTVGRFIYTAVTWLEAARGGQPVPNQVAETAADAEAWCAQRLAEAGLKAPEPLLQP